jgi:hypothetical protein
VVKGVGENKAESSGSGAKGGEREVHMEIGRKESSLVDVDNDLAMIVRRLEGISF